MSKMLSPKLVLLCIISMTCLTAVFAQDGPPADGSRPRMGQRQGPQGRRPNLMRALGLSQEQLQQIKKMNQERKPLLDAAMLRVRNANRALDEAIYTDNFDEPTFQARLRELQLAQADAVKLRFQNELRVRKVLTPEQLARFRQLRQQFAPPPPEDDGPPPDGRNMLQNKRPMRNPGDLPN